MATTASKKPRKTTTEPTLLYGELKERLGPESAEILRDAQTDIDLVTQPHGSLSTPEVHYALRAAYQFGRANVVVGQHTFTLIWNKGSRRFNCLEQQAKAV